MQENQSKKEKNRSFIEEQVPNCTFQMHRIPGGSFMMGDETGELKGMYSPSTPVHKRTGDSFFLAQKQVSQALWAAVLTHPKVQNTHQLNTQPADFQGLNRPVEQVSWEDIQVWLRCLNAITNENYRLPTEAEWEYAARSPHPSKQDLKALELYAGGDQPYESAWFDKNEGQATRTCGLKLPNQFGLLDMSGNVWEWCQDHFEKEYDPKYTDFAAFEGKTGDSRVMRGGSFGITGRDCRSAYRGFLHPGDHWHRYGFRLALSLSEGGG